MKRCSILFCCLGLLLLCGCANEYVITQTNAATLRATTKPQLDAHGYYVFKDGSGEVQRLNSMRVRSIEAVSKGESPKLPFQR